MARMETSVVIDRPIEEVFEYATNPENDTKWQSGILESGLVSDGPVGVGSVTREVRTFLGRRLESTSEITEYEPNAKLAFKSTSGPIQYHAQLLFEPVQGGTKLTITGEADTAGFFKLAEGLVVRQFEKEMQAALASLKGILEGQT